MGLMGSCHRRRGSGLMGIIRLDFSPQLALGLLIALIGVVATLDNLGLASADLVWRYWPLVLVVIGVSVLMHAQVTRQWIYGITWMTAGGLFLARNIGWIHFEIRDLLPLLLVALGARLVFRQRRPAPPPGGAPLSSRPSYPASTDAASTEAWSIGSGRTELASDGPSEAIPSMGPSMGVPPPVPVAEPPRKEVMFGFMGGGVRKVHGNSFQGAELTAVMGGCGLDLRNAGMLGPEAVVDVFVMWGGIEIKVPETWVVVNETLALMGGSDDKTKQLSDPGRIRPRLIVRGFILMGGIEIKN
jgi:Domain of unknown function (DUF5668)